MIEIWCSRRWTARANERGVEIEHRLLMPDGTVNSIHVLARMLETASGDLEYVGAVTDVTATKKADEKIRQSEMGLRQIMDLGPQQVGVLGPDNSRFLSQPVCSAGLSRPDA